jgi:hypothetical protein
VYAERTGFWHYHKGIFLYTVQNQVWGSTFFSLSNWWMKANERKRHEVVSSMKLAACVAELVKLEVRLWAQSDTQPSHLLAHTICAV